LVVHNLAQQGGFRNQFDANQLGDLGVYQGHA
jgi:hypothetical protein